MNILNVGWVSNIVLLIAMAFVVLILTGGTSEAPIWKIVSFGFLVPYIGAIIANQVRLYTMPDAYFTDGTVWSSFKTRFFWNHGPQLSTIFSIYFALLYLGGNAQ